MPGTDGFRFKVLLNQTEQNPASSSMAYELLNTYNIGSIEKIELKHEGIWNFIPNLTIQVQNQVVSSIAHTASIYWNVEYLWKHLYAEHNINAVNE